MYAETQHWKTEMISVNENGLGGFKEVVFMINGQGAYSKLKYESGVHQGTANPGNRIRRTYSYINSNSSYNA